jgi:hypothetical protein
MHIVVDDTYGPEGAAKSKFVTGDRRTHVAVVFPDSEVAYVRQQIGAPFIVATGITCFLSAECGNGASVCQIESREL